MDELCRDLSCLLGSHLNLQDLSNLQSACTNTAYNLKGLSAAKKAMVPWRISLEYRLEGGRAVVDEAWAKVGWAVTRENVEECELCFDARDFLGRRVARSAYDPSQVYTLVRSGVGGPILEELLCGHPTVYVKTYLQGVALVPDRLYTQPARGLTTVDVEILDLERGRNIVNVDRCRGKPVQRIRDMVLYKGITC